MRCSEDRVIVIVKYKVKPGARDDLMREIREANLEGRYRAQPGNIVFNFSAPFTEDDTLYLLDVWEDKPSHDAHVTCDVAPDLAAIKAKYVLETSILRFGAYDIPV